MIFDRGPDGAAEAPRLSRRTFLVAGAAAGGGLVLAFKVPSLFVGTEATAATSFEPNAFVRIGLDGRVTITIPQVEMGQGTFTSCPMLVAEELEVDLSQVQVQQAPPNEKLYGNPLLGGLQATGNSNSIRAFYEPLRQAGATARTMLITAAANTWRVDASACSAEKGVVTHAATGRKLTYGELADKAATLSPPVKVALKDPKDFKLVGTPAKRLDTPAKVNGSAVYGIDAKVPGMKVATVAACPVFGGRLKSVDDSKALAI